MSHITFSLFEKRLKSAGLTHDDVAMAVKARAALAKLKGRLKAAGITHDEVATAASVGRTLVVHVLAGRAKSENVVQTIKRLLDEKGIAT